MFEDIKALTAPLPDDISRAKWAGDIEWAKRLIDARLKKELPSMLRDRLVLERERIDRLARQYPFTRDEALSELRGLIPDLGEDEFDELELDNQLDYIYIRGEKRYFCRFHRTLVKVNPEIARRAGRPIAAQRPLLDEAIASLKSDGRLAYRFRMRASLKVTDESFIAGETYRVYLPIPRPCAQISNVKLIDCQPEARRVSPEGQPQRTVYFEEELAQSRPFSVEYEYDAVLKYADPLAPAPSEPVYSDEEAPCDDDLAEQAPHIAFTPYMRALAAEIAGEEKDKAKLARAAYDFVTTKVNYSFMRAYLQLDSIAELAAVNLKGDCGVQALLFIALCRLMGVPARWQSGLCADSDGAGSHDWAQFYLDGFGWLFADCSFGGSAYRAGATERWNFYFGNLDPYRMVANSAFQQQFSPPMAFLRNDPYDNQEGECECGSRGFAGWELDTDCEVLQITRI